MKDSTKTEIAIATPEDVEGMQEVFYRGWLATYPNTEHGITIAFCTLGRRKDTEQRALSVAPRLEIGSSGAIYFHQLGFINFEFLRKPEKRL